MEYTIGEAYGRLRLYRVHELRDIMRLAFDLACFRLLRQYKYLSGTGTLFELYTTSIEKVVHVNFFLNVHV